jgi:heme exporter protein D
MRSLAEYFAMGGYAVYVWSSYAAAAAVLIGVLIASLRSLRARGAELEAIEGRLPHRSREVRRT